MISFIFSTFSTPLCSSWTTQVYFQHPDVTTLLSKLFVPHTLSAVSIHINAALRILWFHGHFKAHLRRLTFTWWGCYGLCLWHEPTELAHSFLFCSCVCVCLYGPFNCISFCKFSQQLSAFSLCSSSLISALLVLSTTYLFMKVSFSPKIILCGSLGLKHRLTIYLHLHLSHNRGGRWCTTNGFTTSFLHFSRFSTALWHLANSRPVHSLMLSWCWHQGSVTFLLKF